MTEELNLNAIIGLAATTAMVRCGYDQDSRVADLEDDDGWNPVIELTSNYLKWVGLDCSKIEIDKYNVAQSFWGMDEDVLDEALADYEKESHESEMD